MNPIQTNRPVFFGNNGEVLKSGMIHIGQPDQWPLDFPKTVTLQDSVGTQFTAAQPLRTNNQGRITSGGQAVIALVNGDYSMLVRDANGVTVNDGYTPFIANEAEVSEVSGVTQVGLLLSDIKQFVVTPGETVRNVGKLTTLDNLGANWLVVSNTGNPEDDVDLIDFANGAQGRRIANSKIAQDVVSAEGFGGSAQGWQDVTPSRSIGVAYTNSTGRAIFVAVTKAAAGSGTRLGIEIDGVLIATGTNTTSRDYVSFVVPDSATYALTADIGSPGFNFWWELR